MLRSQVRKIGEHVFGAVDHVFFKGLEFIGHASEPLSYAIPEITPETTSTPQAVMEGIKEVAVKDLLPSIQMPSDHVPVIVDFKLPRITQGDSAFLNLILDQPDFVVRLFAAGSFSLAGFPTLKAYTQNCANVTALFSKCNQIEGYKRLYDECNGDAIPAAPLSMPYDKAQLEDALQPRLLNNPEGAEVSLPSTICLIISKPQARTPSQAVVIACTSKDQLSFAYWRKVSKEYTLCWGGASFFEEAGPKEEAFKAPVLKKQVCVCVHPPYFSQNLTPTTAQVSCLKFRPCSNDMVVASDNMVALWRFEKRGVEEVWTWDIGGKVACASCQDIMRAHHTLVRANQVSAMACEGGLSDWKLAVAHESESNASKLIAFQMTESDKPGPATECIHHREVCLHNLMFASRMTLVVFSLCRCMRSLSRTAY